MLKLLRAIRVILPPRFKWEGVALIFMMVFSAILEIATMGLVIPIASAFADPGLLKTNSILRHTCELLHVSSEREFILTFSIILILFSVAKNVFGFCMNCVQSRYSERLGINIAERLYRNYVQTDYSYHLEHNSADLINNIEQTTRFSYQLLCPLMLVVSEIFVFLALAGLVFILAPWVSLSLAVLGAASILLFQRFIRKRVEICSKEGYEGSSGAISALNQSFTSIREVKLSCAEQYFSKKLGNSIWRQNHAQKVVYDLGQVPRFSMEIFVFLAAGIIITILLLLNVSFATIMIFASVFILAAFRLIPSFSRIQYNLITVRNSSYLFWQIYHDLTEIRMEEIKPRCSDGEMTFLDRITVDGVTFRYKPELEPVLRDFSTEIRSCECIGLVGKTGAGKSTLGDILMGFLRPETGKIMIDGRDIRDNICAWRKMIGYVPQSIFLFNTTIRENVAFGVDPKKIDDALLNECMRLAQIRDFVQTLPEKENTVIGNFGIRLSGGQRQRIAIARALYSRPRLLILDEATSALDNETEKAVIDALQVLKGKLTIIMIAHRLSTLHYCDRTITIG